MLPIENKVHFTTENVATLYKQRKQIALTTVLRRSVMLRCSPLI